MSKKYIVNKCGGGIMVPTLLPLVKRQLSLQARQGYFPIVVVSAVKDVTDTIIEFLSATTKNKKSSQDIEKFIVKLRGMHLKLFQTIGVTQEIENRIYAQLEKIFILLSDDLSIYLKNPSAESEAKITAFGEKLSAVCAAEYFSASDLASIAVFAENIPLITDDVVKDANILYPESEKNLQCYISGIKSIPVIAGFTGKNSKGATTLLGRGGTDTTACFVGAALRAHKVVLWKDVGAVYSADPRLVPQAQTIKFLSYDEIEEAGKIIQGKAVRYLRQYKISAEIASLTNSKDKTTVRDTKQTKPGAKMVSFKKNLTLFSLHQGDARGYETLFELSNFCARHKVNVVLVWNDPAYLHVAVEDTSGLLPDLK
ncbi:MAG: hypothetical protein NT034_00190, partial [Candidatus Magasanikbacteria bacterium]|nr:hypothetical protein [Candidatus Magasanikbacteria bacterium]